MKTMYAVTNKQSCDTGTYTLDYTVCVVEEEDTAKFIAETLNEIVLTYDLKNEDITIVRNRNEKIRKLIDTISHPEYMDPLTEEMKKYNLSEKYSPDKRIDDPVDGHFTVRSILIPTKEDIKPQLDEIIKYYHSIIEGE